MHANIEAAEDAQRAQSGIPMKQIAPQNTEPRTTHCVRCRRPDEAGRA